MGDGASSAKAPASLSLRRVEQAMELLAQAKSVDDVKDLRDRAAAMQVYLGQRAAGTTAHADAWEIVQRANRRIGELTREMPQAKRGPKRAVELVSGSEKESPSKGDELRRVGITPKAAHELQQLAALPLTEFQSRLAAGRKKIELGLRPARVTAVSSEAGYDGDEYGTPEIYIAAAREVLGGIELDPASNALAANIVRAERFYTKEDTGLGRPWSARTVWLNSPFSNGLVDLFQRQFVDSYRELHFKAGISLVNSSTETTWYQLLVRGSSALCLCKHRIAFLLKGEPIKGNRYAQTFFYAGPDVQTSARVFGQFGEIVVRYQQTGGS